MAKKNKKDDLSKSVFLGSLKPSTDNPASLGFKVIVDKGEAKIVTLNKPGKQATYSEVRKAQLRNR